MKQLYTKRYQQGQIIFVSLYVDDMIYSGNLELTSFKHAMQFEFEMKYLGIMKYFLAIEVDQSTKGIFVCQRNKYHQNILHGRLQSNRNSYTPRHKIEQARLRPYSGFYFVLKFYRKFVVSYNN